MQGIEVDRLSASYAEGVRDGKREIATQLRSVLMDIARRMRVTAEVIEKMERILTTVH